MRLASLCLVQSVTLLVGCGGDDGDGDGPPELGWELVWSDEFDGPAGQSPDATRWRFDEGGGGFGNQQLEFNTSRPDNASLDGQGNLSITARRESYEGNAYTSARMTTKGLFDQAYGRIEARIKLPIGQGIWPAFWMLGSNIDSVGWPACGEIDIMEFRGQEPSIVHGSLHGPGYSAGQAVTETFSLPNDESLANDFHVFAAEWDMGRIAFSVDGVVYQVITTGKVASAGQWAFDHPFHLILNVAVGGTFVGDPNDATVFPQTMLVDYVRVHRRPSK